MSCRKLSLYQNSMIFLGKYIVCSYDYDIHSEDCSSTEYTETL